MPLYASLARENFPLRMGTVIGGTAMAGSLGMKHEAIVQAAGQASVETGNQENGLSTNTQRSHIGR
jgi:hypothetical protein